VSTVAFILPFLIVYAILAIYAERKLSAFIQDRLGPMEVGPYGILQTVADLIKLLQKEDIAPAASDTRVFKLAPVLIFAIVFTGFAFVPLSPGWSGVSFSSGIFLLLAIVALDVIGVIMAGWSSNNKYSSLGTLRSAAQIISYEVPLGLSVVCVAIVCQSLDLQEISYQQGTLIHDWKGLEGDNNFFFGIRALDLNTTATGGFLSWNVFRMPLLFPVWIIFFIASLAECNRAPFDLPEAESELVAGFHTEYGGFRWGIIMLGEYALMLLVSMLSVILFWGSWNSPIPNFPSLALADWTTGNTWGIFWLVLKTGIMVALQIWVRWTFPRLRIDQLMSLGWKYLIPVSFGLIISIGCWKIYLS
jgi:NADH-quinone oxidoreductase subunit H